MLAISLKLSSKRAQGEVVVPIVRQVMISPLNVRFEAGQVSDDFRQGAARWKGRGEGCCL